MPPQLPNPDRNERPQATSLEYQLEKHGTFLAMLAEPNRPLTVHRLIERVPEADRILEEVMDQGIEWPTSEMAVPIHLDGRMRRYFTRNPEADDVAFADEAWEHRLGKVPYRGFNNFPAILSSRPQIPEITEEGVLEVRDDMARALYGSKPYLLRAYVLAPDFMRSLRSATAACDGMAGWNHALRIGAMSPEECPEQAHLLRASRLAYGLFANLMRVDDLQRQTEWFGFGRTTALIDNPETELWT